jgi:hypothetical protein
LRKAINKLRYSVSVVRPIQRRSYLGLGMTINHHASNEEGSVAGGLSAPSGDPDHGDAQDWGCFSIEAR